MRGTMANITVVNKDTGEEIWMEQRKYFQQIRKQGEYVLPEEYIPVIVEEKRKPGRPKKDK